MKNIRIYFSYMNFSSLFQINLYIQMNRMYLFIKKFYFSIFRLLSTTNQAIRKIVNINGTSCLIGGPSSSCSHATFIIYHRNCMRTKRTGISDHT